MKKLIMAVLLMPMMALAATWYVNGSGGSDSNTGKSQSSAKATIQAAIDEAIDGDTILVAPGTYAPITTENKAITIRSISGAASTIIDGNNVRRCVTALPRAHKGSLSAVVCTNTCVYGFTLQNGNSGEERHADEIINFGGGGIGGTYYNCRILNNRAGGGGGCDGAILHNCLLKGNYAANGGATESSVCYNCTITENSVRDSGVAGWNSAFLNCIVYGNANCWAIYYTNHDEGTGKPAYDLNYCKKNVYETDPGFVDAANGDYRLAVGSPCIDAGDNSYVTTMTDLSCNARIANGTVDIGCYEYGSSPVHTPVWEDENNWYKSNYDGENWNHGVTLKESVLHLEEHESGARLFLSVCGSGVLKIRARGSSDGFWVGYDNGSYTEGYIQYVRADSFLDYVIDISGDGLHTILWTTYPESWAWGEIKSVSWNGVPIPLTGAVPYLPPVSATYMVTFNPNGGSLGTTSPIRAVEDGNAVGTLPSAVREGYTLAGWWTSASGGVQIDGAETVTGNVTYYAHWTENPETPPDETAMEWSDGTTTWHYEYIDRNNSDFGIVITGIELSNVTSVQVPSEIGSRIVTKIGTGDPLSGGANLTGVTIPSSVTMIGDNAFSGCANLRSATIAASHIGSGAFAACENLSNLTISEGVTGIGMYAFENCSSLTSVTLPSTVRYVDDSAFEYCDGLASVKIKATDARIHKNAFADCGNAFHDYKTIPGLVLVDGWVMGFDENSDRWYNADTIDINFTGARGIASYAFSGCGITSVKIPSSVKCVGECAFEYCGMERVELQASLTAIHRGAFRNNSFTSFAIPGSVQLIGQEAFAECGNLKRIEIPGSVVSIGPDAFAGCTSLGDLRLSAGLRQIQSGAFWDCPLTTLSFPDTVVSIEYAFNNIELRSLVIPDSVRYCDQTFIAETATLPAGVDCVDHEAIRSLTITPGTGKVSYLFNSCPNLERVTIQKGVTSIDHAFCECENLKTVSIADGVSHMTASFAGCNESAYDTTTIPGVKLLGGWAMGYTGNLPANLNLKGCRGIYYGAFDGAGLTGVTIPNTVKYIGDYAFVGCNLQSIKIPDSVEEIGYGAFGDDYGLAIFDKTTIKGAVMVDGWIMDCDPDAYGSDGGTLDLTGARGIVNNASLHRLCPVSVYIPSTVSRIPESAFDYCDSLQQIVLAEGVKSIGARAFAGTGISYVVDDSVILCCGMGNSAIVLPSSLTEIGDEAFSECEYLSSVDIAKSNVKTIGQGAFPSPLQRMTLPSKLETLGKLGWSGGGLKVPASVSFVERGALEGFNLLEFEGNAPVVCEIGYGLPTAIVPRDSTGWGVAIPSSTLIYAGGGAGPADTLPAAKPKPAIYCDSSYTVVPGQSCSIPITVLSTIKKTTVTVKGLPSGLKYSGGKITGKAKKPGTSKVTITAKNTKGSATKKITIKVKNPGFAVAVAPRKVNGSAVDSDTIETSGQTVTVRVGFSQSFALSVVPGVSGVSGSTATVKVTGLPSGLAYKNGAISGVPRKAGTKTATVKCSNKWGWSKTFTIKIKVVSLPSEVVGTFNGYTVSTICNDNRLDYNSQMVKVTVTSNGKLSAKIGSVTWTASSWSALDEGSCYYPAVYTAVLKRSPDNGSRLNLRVNLGEAWNSLQMVGSIMNNGIGERNIVAQRNPFGKNAKKKYINAEAGGIATKLSKYGNMPTAVSVVGSGVYELIGPVCTIINSYPVTFKVSSSGVVTISGKVGGQKLSGTTVLRVSESSWMVSPFRIATSDEEVDHDDDDEPIDDESKNEKCLQADFCLGTPSKPIRVHVEFNPMDKGCRHGWVTIGKHTWDEYFQYDDEDEDEDDWDDE